MYSWRNLLGSLETTDPGARRRSSGISVAPIDNERICTQIGAHTCLSRLRNRNALRRSAEARVLQLPGAARSDAARHAILRSVVDPKRAAHHPILDIGQAAAGRADDDQRPGQAFGDGSNHAGPQYPSARARRIDRDRAGQRRPQEQGRAFDRGRRGAVARRARGLDASAGKIRDSLRPPARRTVAGSASRCHGDGARCRAARRQLSRRAARSHEPTSIQRRPSQDARTCRSQSMARPPLPPFTAETAAQKARLAEDAWNTRDPARVALGYTVDSIWRNRAEFIHGRQEIEAFLTRKWNRDPDYRLIKAVWTLRDNRIAVRFAYEWHDDSGNWFRSYGNENWEFDDDGLMRRRIASINDLPIEDGERKYHWPLGRRPDDHPSLSDLGL